MKPTYNHLHRIQEPIGVKQILFKLVNIMNLILMVLGITLSSWLIVYAIMNPLKGPRFIIYIPLLIISSITFNRIFAVLQKIFLRKKPHTMMTIFKWASPLIFPFLLFSYTEWMVNNQSLKVVKKNLSPVIHYIERWRNHAGHFPTDILEALKNVERIKKVEYYIGEESFVIAAYAGTIDIDGSKIFYYSKDKHWLQLHNDYVDINIGNIFSTATNEKDVIKYNLQQNNEWELIYTREFNQSSGKKSIVSNRR